MPKYTCERCLKEFSQKSHYTKHQNKKIPCQDNKGKIEDVVENIIINKKLISNNTENIIQTTMESQPETLTKSENKSMNFVENVKTQVIINGDCIIKMKEIKNDSVDIIICDPPYNIGGTLRSLCLTNNIFMRISLTQISSFFKYELY